ncbi:MAG TPA: glycosyltransferase, partial [Ktedonobacteraceae bacterium]|nr:glycosyltransferase [Ktedonobacteraceae bacterium]
MEKNSHTNKQRGRSVSRRDPIYRVPRSAPTMDEGSSGTYTVDPSLADLSGGERSEENPYVMVLMPTFNQAPFIRRALESLLSQTLTNWNLAIIDDGSLDNTQAL